VRHTVDRGNSRRPMTMLQSCWIPMVIVSVSGLADSQSWVANSLGVPTDHAGMMMLGSRDGRPVDLHHIIGQGRN
jgi:hypothetical protein